MYDVEIKKHILIINITLDATENDLVGIFFTNQIL
jgi:hypothetical protein